MMNCYLQSKNKCLRYYSLYTCILKSGILTRDIKLRLFLFFKVLGVSQFWRSLSFEVPRFRPFWWERHKKFAEYKWSYGVRILVCLISWWGFLFVLSTGYFPFLVGISPSLYRLKDSEKLVLRVIIFSCSSHDFSFIERNLKKWILSTTSSDKQQRRFYVDYGVLKLKEQSDSMEIWQHWTEVGD